MSKSSSSLLLLAFHSGENSCKPGPAQVLGQDCRDCGMQKSRAPGKLHAHESSASHAHTAANHKACRLTSSRAARFRCARDSS